MSSVTFRSGRESASWTSADLPRHDNHDAHDSDSNSEDSSDDDSSGDEAEDTQSKDVDEDEEDDAGDNSFGSDTISEFEAALIGQLEENENEHNDESITLPNTDITDELIEFSGIGNEEDSDDEDMEDVMATMSTLDSGASTIVASSPTASTLVASAPTSPSTTEPKTDFPGVQPNVGSKRRRVIVDEDNEEESAAYKKLRLSSVEQEKPNDAITNAPPVGVLTQEDNPTTPSQASATHVSTLEEAVENSDPHSIPVINSESNTDTKMPVSWPGLPRPKHCVKLKSYGGMVPSRTRQTSPILGVPVQQAPPSFYYPHFPIQSVASLPIHAQTEVPSVSTSSLTATHRSSHPLSPPQPPIGPYQAAAFPNYFFGLNDPPPNQFLTQPVFPYVDIPQNMTVDPSTLCLAGYNMNPEMTMPLANEFTVNSGTQGYHHTPQAISAPQILPQTSYIQDYGGMCPMAHPQPQEPYGSYSGTAAATATSPILNSVASSSSSNTVVPTTISTSNSVVGSSGIVAATSTSAGSTKSVVNSLSSPTFTRLPQKVLVCQWVLDDGHICDQTVVGDDEVGGHIANHTLIYRGDKDWNEWENTPLHCQWQYCGASLKAGSLKKHVMRQHFCMKGEKCDRCGHEYGCHDAFKKHLLKDGQCRALKSAKT